MNTHQLRDLCKDNYICEYCVYILSQTFEREKNSFLLIKYNYLDTHFCQHPNYQKAKIRKSSHREKHQMLQLPT